tara:strand:- start:221 stop:385 length:165 start_codon:yes stop_codon:yes gene_type:complete
MVINLLIQLVVEVVLVALVVTGVLQTMAVLVVLVDKLLPHLEILFLHLHPLVVD